MYVSIAALEQDREPENGEFPHSIKLLDQE